MEGPGSARGIGAATVTLCFLYLFFFWFGLFHLTPRPTTTAGLFFIHRKVLRGASVCIPV